MEKAILIMTEANEHKRNLGDADMPFPNVKRVIYNKNPLESVVCQLRFPPILRIDAEIPVLFHESIRHAFPMIAEAEWNIQIPQNLKGQLSPDTIQQIVQSSGIKNYEFSSEDGLWRVNLTRHFIALTTTKYDRWENFKNQLDIPLSALINIYKPSYFTRIGLRYIDIIKRSELGLNNFEWKDLIQPHIVGLLGDPEIGFNVEDFESRYDIKLGDDNSIVRIVNKFVEEEATKEKFFSIDSDIHILDKVEIKDAIIKLDIFNSHASHLIQWAITNKLHNAMEPQDI